MAGRAIMYCRELIKELNMIPVYYPGTPVKPGDVLAFRHFNLLGKPQPISTFTKEFSLSDYFKIDTEKDKEPEPIRFASKEGVSLDFDGSVDVGEFGKGQLSIKFSKSGSTFLAATGVTLERIQNLEKLRSDLVRIKNRYSGDWSKSFIVTSVRVAAKSIIMQSSSENGALVIDGNARNLQPGSPAEIEASLKLSVSSYKDASFLKDWSDNVEIFFGLSRFRKRYTGEWGFRHSLAPTKSADWELSSVYPDDVDFSE
jgi:hypothetical protein